MRKLYIRREVKLYASESYVPALFVDLHDPSDMLVDVVPFQIFGDGHLGDRVALQVCALLDQHIFADNILISGNPSDPEAGTENLGETTCT